VTESGEASAPAIEADGLTRDFGALRAVDALTVSVPRGQVIGLLGHNGAGKTTTIRVLNGLLTPTSGTSRVLGLDPAVDGPALRARTGVLTETPSLDERLTAAENLGFAARLVGLEGAAATRRVDALLERFDLVARARDRVGGYSRGMKQRLALARALLHEPDLVFLDEPTAALDPVAARDVHAIIRELSAEQSRTVVVTTHNLVEAQRLCDRVIILRHGRMIADGTPSALSTQLSGAGRLELEVEAADADRAAAIARKLVVTDEVWVDGGVVSIDGAGRAQVPALLAALVAAEVSVYRITPGEPSLEDVYFALHADEVET
jgi:ABC-2 type transport system ATP-binding protein